MQSLLATLSALALGLVFGRSTRRTRPEVAPPPAPSPSLEPGTSSVEARSVVNPWKLVLGAVMIVFAVIAAIFFAYQLRAVLTLMVVSLLLSVGLQGPVSRLGRFGVPRAAGLLIVYLGVIAALVLAGWLLLPQVYRDLRELAVQAPNYASEAEAQLARLGVQAAIPNLVDLERIALTEVTNDFSSYANRVLSILGYAVGVLGGVLNALLVMVLSIFIVTEGPAFRAHLLSLLPTDKQELWSSITDRIAIKIQGWFRGTLFLGLVVGGVTTVALLLLGMPYAFLLGVVAGVGELIPMIGPIIAAIPAVGIAAFNGWGMFGLVLALYILIQQVENYVLVPRIMGSTVDLPGLFVLVAFLVGSELLGLTGAILSMPVAAVVQVLWTDWFVPSVRKGRGGTPVNVRLSAASVARSDGTPSPAGAS